MTMQLVPVSRGVIASVAGVYVKAGSVLVDLVIEKQSGFRGAVLAHFAGVSAGKGGGGSGSGWGDGLTGSGLFRD